MKIPVFNWLGDPTAVGLVKGFKILEAFSFKTEWTSTVWKWGLDVFNEEFIFEAIHSVGFNLKK